MVDLLLVGFYRDAIRTSSIVWGSTLIVRNTPDKRRPSLHSAE